MPDRKNPEHEDEDWGPLSDLLHTLQQELEAGNQKMQAKADGPHLRISNCHIKLPLLLKKDPEKGELEVALPKPPSASIEERKAKARPPETTAKTGSAPKKGRQTAAARAKAAATAVEAEQKLVAEALREEELLNSRLTLLDLNFKGHYADQSGD